MLSDANNWSELLNDHERRNARGARSGSMIQSRSDFAFHRYFGSPVIVGPRELTLTFRDQTTLTAFARAAARIVKGKVIPTGTIIHSTAPNMHSPLGMLLRFGYLVSRIRQIQITSKFIEAADGMDEKDALSFEALGDHKYKTISSLFIPYQPTDGHLPTYFTSYIKLKASRIVFRIYFVPEQAFHQLFPFMFRCPLTGEPIGIPFGLLVDSSGDRMIVNESVGTYSTSVMGYPLHPDKFCTSRSVQGPMFQALYANSTAHSDRYGMEACVSFAKVGLAKIVRHGNVYVLGLGTRPMMSPLDDSESEVLIDPDRQELTDLYED